MSGLNNERALLDIPLTVTRPRTFFIFNTLNYSINKMDKCYFKTYFFSFAERHFSNVSVQQTTSYTV